MVIFIFFSGVEKTGEGDVCQSNRKREGEATSVFHFARCHMANRQVVDAAADYLWYMGYWIILGVASSVGLGTGLHTFMLYLGPHIASVTTVAVMCRSVDFDTRGDDAFVCPDDGWSKHAVVGSRRGRGRVCGLE